MKPRRSAPPGIGSHRSQIWGEELGEPVLEAIPAIAGEWQVVGSAQTRNSVPAVWLSAAVSAPARERVEVLGLRAIPVQGSCPRHNGHGQQSPGQRSRFVLGNFVARWSLNIRDVLMEHALLGNVQPQGIFVVIAYYRHGGRSSHRSRRAGPVAGRWIGEMAARGTSIEFDHSISAGPFRRDAMRVHGLRRNPPSLKIRSLRCDVSCAACLLVIVGTGAEPAWSHPGRGHNAPQVAMQIGAGVANAAQPVQPPQSGSSNPPSRRGPKALPHFER